MLEAYPVTGKSVYEALIRQQVRDDYGIMVGRQVFNTRPQGLSTRIAYHVLYRDGIVAHLLEAYVVRNVTNKFLGDVYKDGNLACFVSTDRVGERLGVSGRTVKRIFARLRGYGIIEDLGIISPSRYARMPVLGLGHWKWHSERQNRVEVFRLDIAAGAYDEKLEEAHFAKYREERDQLLQDAFRAEELGLI